MEAQAKLLQMGPRWPQRNQPEYVLYVRVLHRRRLRWPAGRRCELRPALQPRRDRRQRGGDGGGGRTWDRRGACHGSGCRPGL